MYTEHFGLREEPFNITPDPKFLFPSANHQEALARISHGVSMRKGIMALIGEAGTGKTTLIRTLLRGLNGNTVSAWVFNTTLQNEALISYICKDFGMKIKKGDNSDLLMELHRFLMDNYENGKNAILIVDEAQNVDSKLLEQIRQMTNLETVTQKLLQVILSGQPQLEKLLAKPELKQLSQRVSVRARLTRLSKEDTVKYIQHRLNVVGGNCQEIFEERALEAVYEVSKGIPRLINVVCDNAMIRAKMEGATSIGANTVIALVREGLLTMADRQKESTIEKARIKPMGLRKPKVVPRLNSFGNNGNGKLKSVVEFATEFAGVDMGMLAIA